MEFEVNFPGNPEGRRKTNRPFNILVLGNFGGQTAAPSSETPESAASRNIVRVDLDNADDLWSIFSPQLSLRTGSASIRFSPSDIDDFHPDQLYRALPLFQEFRDTRKSLLDPATAQATLDAILSARGAIEGELVDEPAPSLDDGTEEDAEAMFQRLLGEPRGHAPQHKKTSPELVKLDSFIRDLIAPHIVYEQDPRVDTAVDSVELATAELMRSILHDPDFQALEASWRSLIDLVAELELDENLRLHVCDISRADLLAGLPDPGSSLADSALFQLLVERRRQAADDTPWTVIIGDFQFGPGPEDIALLTALGAAAATQGGIFLGGARPEILGCSSTAELTDSRYWSVGDEGQSLWQSLRTSPFAGHIGLALPRVLARLPYGKGAEEIETFVFEEMLQRNHEQYLWGNPAYACGRLLAECFTSEGWNMQPGHHVDLGYLPAHHYTENGESRLQPCAELLLSESTMVAMLNQGLMPLISYRNQNTAVLGRFQSIADPLKSLSGPWE